MRRPRSRSVPAAAVVVAALLGAGCAATDDPTLEADDAPTTTATTSGPVTTPTTAPATTAPPTTVVAPPTAPPTAPPLPTAPPIDPFLAPVVAGERPRAAGEPIALAAQIRASELAIRDPATPPDVLAAAGHLQQVAYRQLGVHPEWDTTVLNGTPQELHQTIGRNIAARREFRSMQRRLAENVPAWRIVDPLPAPELRALYAEAEAAFGVPWHVLAAVNLVETGMGRIVGLSSAGAQGPMQFIPSTWAAFGMGGNIEDPRDAILGAANYLAANGGARGTEDGLDNALFRYNNDQRYVRAVRHYSAIMAEDEATYLGFHAWQIYYLSAAGDLWFPTGYELLESTPVAEWLATNPQ